MIGIHPLSEALQHYYLTLEKLRHWHPRGLVSQLWKKMWLCVRWSKAQLNPSNSVPMLLHLEYLELLPKLPLFLSCYKLKAKAGTQVHAEKRASS